MAPYNGICILCFDYIEETNVQIINKSIEDMLQTVLMNVDLSTTPNCAICKTCHGKLEKNYGFKMKCVFTEDTINPFVIDNIKINLNEICNQIIKSESPETKKNVCRLCLQYNDDDMTLSNDEKQKFEALFPEINLNLTNFVVLCLSCYNMLQKYFIFVTSCTRSEDPLCKHDGKHEDSPEFSINVEEVAEKKIEVLFNKKVEIKSEEFNDLSEEQLCSSSIDCSIKQISGIKSEEAKSYLKNIENKDDKKLILHEELNIKSDEDLMDMECCYNHGNNLTSYKLQSNRVEAQSERLFEDCKYSNCDTITMKDCNSQQKEKILTVLNDSAKNRMYKCKDCSYATKFKIWLQKHILNMHTDPSKIHKCDTCDYKSKYANSLKLHVITKHTDPSKIRLYQCEDCKYRTMYETQLKKHIMKDHTDPSKSRIYQCEDCNYRTIYKTYLKNHVFNKHTGSLKTLIYKCNICDYKSKYSTCLKRHVLYSHTGQTYKCQYCNYKSKYSNSLKIHVMSKHTDPYKNWSYQCKDCNYRTKYKTYLEKHIFKNHKESLEIKKYKCHVCNFKSKYLICVKRHVKNKHTDPPIIQMYKCEYCDYESKWSNYLKTHILNNHAEFLKTTMYQCNVCDFKSKFLNSLRRHVKSKHTDPSKVRMYKCEYCEYESNLSNCLKTHTLNTHADSPKTKMYQCNVCDYKSKYHNCLKRHVKSKHNMDLSKIGMYKCEYCNYESNLSSLKTHILHDHSDSPKTKIYQCKDCDYKSKYLNCLTRHVKNKHTDPSEIQKC